jgi:pimeloyl-ACP methyl ester carboxylesterase
MGNLDVPGTRLHYETYGSGPLLLMVPGANGSADAFKAVAEHLAEQHTVVTYDRRGFSRSQLNGPQDYTQRLETDYTQRLETDYTQRLETDLEPLAAQAGFGEIRTGEVPPWTRYFRLSRTVPSPARSRS